MMGGVKAKQGFYLSDHFGAISQGDPLSVSIAARGN